MSGAPRMAGVRMPRRHPRAVYEVYDAEEALGEHGLPVSGDEPVDAEPVPAAEQATRAADRGPAHIASRRPERFAPGRMLAGVLLCAVAVCVLVAVGIALLHVLSGAGAGVGRRVAAPSSLGPRGAHGEDSAPIERTDAIERAAAAERAEAVSPTEALLRQEATRSTLRVEHARQGGPRHDPAGLLPAGSGESPELQTQWAAPAPSMGCACAAAEVEFGFER